MGNGAMKTPYSYDSHEISPLSMKTMASTPQISQLRGDSTMERMKKILGSPMTRKKNIAPPPSNSYTLPSSSDSQSTGTSSSHSPGPGYVGLLLSDIVRRENQSIPNLVTKVCSYIYKNGLENEGIFRVNGNSKVVEKLRSSFDQTGDADLDEAGDVMAVAGLLKLFLRELPDALIPEKLTQSFVSTQEDYAREHDLCILKFRTLLQKLPQANYDTLKYLVRFLVLVTLREVMNKMGPMALGIVFGPNLFSLPGFDDRCSGGIQGLKDQGITNHIALKFIKHYDTIFKEEGEISPSSPGFVLTTGSTKQKAPPPPRPPPPKVEDNSSPPIPSPRKQRTKPNGTLPRGHMITDNDIDRDASDKASEAGSRSDEEFLDTHRSGSPFVLDSDRSECGTLVSPRTALPAGHTHVVDKAITSAITEHLFGDSSSTHSSDDSATSNSKASPVPAPRRKKRQLEKTGGAAEEKPELERKISVKDRISQLQAESSDAVDMRDDDKPKKQRPKSKAFEMFEEQGIIIGMAPPDLSTIRAQQRARQGTEEWQEDAEEDKTSSGRSSPQPVPKPRSPRKHAPAQVREPASDQTGADLEVLPQPAPDTLAAFRRAPGPKNRRNPSRPKRISLESQQMETESPEASGQKENPQPARPRPFLYDESLKGVGSGDEGGDVNHNATKPSISFLNQHPSCQRDNSPEKSPTVHRKPCVPPLDLSILHEHGDGNEPISAEQGHSLSLQKQYKNDDAAILSPRMTKLKQKKNAHPDTDVPPSPPTDQTHIQSKRIDDANSVLMKQLTKRIQSFKKKIKTFEETFEQEHGYRPSKTDKVSHPDIKRNMRELDKARKELRTLAKETSPMQIQGNWNFTHGNVFTFDGVSSSPEVCPKQTESKYGEVKEEMESERRAASPGGLAVLPNGRTEYEDGHVTSPDRPPTMDETRHLLFRKLHDKRSDNHRPEDLEEMTREETQDEKLAVQKALLHFENIHGRPTTKAEKELMRPLYDRYRNIKRILTKPPSPRDKMQELQAVPEDRTIEFTPSPGTAQTMERDLVRVPTADHEEDGEDFLVTKDMRLLKDTIRQPPLLPAPNVDLSPEESPRNLHELTVPQLVEEQQRAKADKKRLRKILRDFEEEFMQQTGRKVLKEDRVPMESEYQQYKQVKARIKLLDALITKHDPLSAY